MATPRPLKLRYGPPVLAAGALAMGAAAWWQLAQAGASPGVSWPHFALLGALLGAGLATALAARQQSLALRRAIQAEAEARRTLTQLRAVMDVLPENGVFTLFDAEDRLVMVNAGFRALYPQTAPFIVPGAAYEDILRRAVAAGEVAEARGREETWVQQRLAQHRAPATQLTQSLPGDRWVRINERRTADGGIVGLRTDVTDTVRKERDLEHARLLAQRAQSQLYEALEAMPIGMELFDENDRLVFFNQRMAEMRPQFSLRDALGKTHEELLRIGLLAGVPAEALGQEEAWISRRLAERGRRAAPEVRGYPNGVWTQAHERRTPSGYVVCVRLDITELVQQRLAVETAQHAAQEARRLLESAIEALPVGIEIFDPQDRMVLHNQHLARLYGHIDLRQMVGQTFDTLVRMSLRHQWISAAIGREEEWLAERLAKRGTHQTPLLQEVAGGRWIHGYETRTPEGYIVAARMEVTEMVHQRQALEVANNRLALLSATDGLTGIANRRHFDETLASEWLRGARQGETLSLLLIDIDHFKRYNDCYGHLAGDECLRQVAQILRDCVRRSGELAARYGGEEFALLLPATDTHNARLLAERCMAQLHAAAIPHSNSPTAPQLTLSIGISWAVPNPDCKPEALVDAADAALYRAKNEGRHRFAITDLFDMRPAEE